MTDHKADFLFNVLRSITKKTVKLEGRHILSEILIALLQKLVKHMTNRLACVLATAMITVTILLSIHIFVHQLLITISIPAQTKITPSKEYNALQFIF